MTRWPVTRWIFASDLQLENPDPHEERKRRLIERVAEEKPQFVINGGDHINGVVNDDHEEFRNARQMWKTYHRVMSPLKELCPVISTVGNHDQTGSDPSSEEYLRQVGRHGRATYCARTIAGVHIANMDVVAGRHCGELMDRTQARWLRRDLRARRRARCTVVVGHYPIFTAPVLQQHSLLRDEQTSENGFLLPLLCDAGVDLYLCGHLHTYERCRYKRMTQLMTSASAPVLSEMRENPGEYREAFGEWQTYVRFTLEDSTIRGEAVSAEGDVVDQWTQKLNR